MHSAIQYITYYDSIYIEHICLCLVSLYNIRTDDVCTYWLGAASSFSHSPAAASVSLRRGGLITLVMASPEVLSEGVNVKDGADKDPLAAAGRYRPRPW
jgi:hypothetical protein